MPYTGQVSYVVVPIRNIDIDRKSHTKGLSQGKEGYISRDCPSSLRKRRGSEQPGVYDYPGPTS